MNENKELNEDELKTALRYYDYARKEIEREDTITNQRVTSTLTFQGFLVTAAALIVGGTNIGFEEFKYPRLLALMIISLAGIALSRMSYRGIKSSLKSLRFAKNQWVEFNRAHGNIYPRFVPQLTRRSDEPKTDATADQGGRYAMSIPIITGCLWLCAFVGFAAVTYLKYVNSVTGP